MKKLRAVFQNFRFFCFLILSAPHYFCWTHSNYAWGYCIHQRAYRWIQESALYAICSDHTRYTSSRTSKRLQTCNREQFALYSITHRHVVFALLERVLRRLHPQHQYRRQLLRVPQFVYLYLLIKNNVLFLTFLFFCYNNLLFHYSFL